MKKYEHWQIAYRESEDDIFKLVPNPRWAWAADPFLTEYGDKIYLFAELFLYRSERNGIIGCCEYQNGKFGEWMVAMDCHWHLSYPNVWTSDGKLYMCPETYQTGEVAIYELISFPDKWKKVRVLLQNGKYVDSTFMTYSNKKYLYTYHLTNPPIEGELLLYEILPDNTLSDKICISNDIGNARPAGNIIVSGDKMIRVSQNSTGGGYGTGLVFSEIKSVAPFYEEKELMRIGSHDIKGSWTKEFVGIHTYNRYKNIEVIDLKYRTDSLTERIAQKRVRRVFTNKY